ncbi:RNA ligase [Moraxella lacunata]|uniref:RNA ligase n=1 Tax=Moraxella lacunata TaxID=477 RepID=A0A378TU49_MORLA|nr:RNA ligase [Moraxella lacunata]STZ64267.1 RNA ligase [Moraxella lacunata]
MQKFILIRGHQGSGKSTFAEQKIAEFKTQFPNGEIVHIENDKLLIDENGVYHWTPERIEKAVQIGQTAMKTAFEKAKANPNLDMLVINSNTNQKSSSCIHLLQSARKKGLVTEIYRLHNFFDNVHNVKRADVLSAYIKLNNNQLRDEIHIEPIRPMSDDIKTDIEKMSQFDNKKELPFDENRQSYISDEYLQYGKRNFIIKQSKTYPELFVLKYKREIFFNNRFDNALLEMRGTVIDKYNNIIVRPFKKVFNYSERISKNSKYPIKISDDTLVDAVLKVNGFLGLCTYVELDESHPSYQASFNKKVLYSTTGSLDSDFAKMNKTHCQKYEPLFKQYPNHTFLFEITDEKDVHIIKEIFGETLIGMIDVASGRQFDEDEINAIADKFNAEQEKLNTGIKITRPQIIKSIPFGELKILLKTVEHEGFMVFDSASKEMLFKLKSPYYLISKFLGRSKASNLGRKLDKRQVDEEYYPLIDYIKDNQENFNQLSELDKIAFIQEFLGRL